jgi:hypothetical protein
LYQSHEDYPTKSTTHQPVPSQNYFQLDRPRRGKGHDNTKASPSTVAGETDDPFARWMAQSMDDEPYHNIEGVVSYDWQLSASVVSDNTACGQHAGQDTGSWATYGSSQHDQNTHK